MVLNVQDLEAHLVDHVSKQKDNPDEITNNKLHWVIIIQLHPVNPPYLSESYPQ